MMRFLDGPAKGEVPAADSPRFLRVVLRGGVPSVLDKPDARPDGSATVYVYQRTGLARGRMSSTVDGKAVERRFEWGYYSLVRPAPGKKHLYSPAAWRKWMKGREAP